LGARERQSCPFFGNGARFTALAQAARRSISATSSCSCLFICWCFSLLFSFKNSYQSSTTEKKTVNQWKKEEEKEKHKNHKLLPGCPILSLFLSLLLMYCFLSKYDDDDDGGGGDDDDDDDDDRY